MPLESCLSPHGRFEVTVRNPDRHVKQTLGQTSLNFQAKVNFVFIKMKTVFNVIGRDKIHREKISIQQRQSKSLLVSQSCPALCHPMDCSLPGSPIHGIVQTRILECSAIPLSRGIFPAQGLNRGLLHCRQISYCVSHHGSPPKTQAQDQIKRILTFELIA